MRIIIVSVAFFLCVACKQKSAPLEVAKKIKLVTLDPGHFHAALVQKTAYPQVDSTVHVYATGGNDLDWHLNRIASYNTRSESPTHWNQQVYTGNDFFEKMIAEKRGNVVVLSGNNKKKTEYISGALANGFNVLADKPMAIDSKGFEQLQQAFDLAHTKKLLLYDIMTERYEITTMLQRELSQMPEVFGVLEKGTTENPAITKESVHHFYKYVSGDVLTRPAWFLDAAQQGEGIVDVMTHLVDLVQWECFPEQIIDYKNEVKIDEARRWPTHITLSEFKAVTKLDEFPSFLNSNVKDTVLQVFCNGEINYTLKGVSAKTSVIWKYKAPEGSADTHYSIMRGTKANIIIRQGAEENYKPVLYLEPITSTPDYENSLGKSMAMLQSKYPGVEAEKSSKGWIIVIPEKYKEGHEAHFARVTEKFIEYLESGSLPKWEVPNMISKYYTTTQALDLALKRADQK